MRGPRIALRLAQLGAALAGAALGLAILRRDGPESIHRLSRRLLRILAVRLTVTGAVPTGGLLVCNHLGYLDVLVLAATGPVTFVAKSEVRSWPVFGWFARRAGTVFVERRRTASLVGSARQVSVALRAERRVVLFPEGTSSGGETVLPFKSALLEAARHQPIWTAAIAYALEPGEGDPAEAVCYWRDMSLPSHLLRLLGRRRIFATLAFAPPAPGATDRKALALELHGRVRALKAQAERAPRAGETLPLRRVRPTKGVTAPARLE